MKPQPVEASIENGTGGEHPIEVSFPLPRAPGTNIHLQLISTYVYLRATLTTVIAESPTATPLGSFVCALPDPSSPTNALCTPLYTQGATLDFTTRLAKLLVRRIGKPVYVANSMSFVSAGMGGTIEEEMEAFGRCVEVITGLVNGGDKE